MSCVNLKSLDFLLSKSIACYKERNQGGEKIVTFSDGKIYKVATNGAFMIAIPLSDGSNENCDGNIPETLLNMFDSSLEDIASAKRKVSFVYETFKESFSNNKNSLV